MMFLGVESALLIGFAIFFFLMFHTMSGIELISLVECITTPAGLFIESILLNLSGIMFSFLWWA